MTIKNLLFLLLLGVALVWIVGILSIRPRSGPEHSFPLETTPSFLSEELAVEKARATLAVEGYDVDQWKLTHGDQPGSQAPDGTPDRYLDRFQSTCGRVSFSDGKRHRTYDVSLQGSRVVCRGFRGL